MDTLIEFTKPLLSHGLTVLEGYLGIAEEAVGRGEFSESEIVGARLAPDMMSFAGQIQRASDTAKNGLSRVIGIRPPSFEDNETSFPELRQRIERTERFLAGIKPAELVQPNADVVEFRFGLVHKEFSRQQYVQKFLLPNFFFHLSTAHGILRHLGVKVGKLNYLGSLD